MIYDLTQYSLSIVPDDAALAQLASVIGGVVVTSANGNGVDKIDVGLNSDQWSTKGYANGAWEHNKSYNRTGTVNVSVSQLSEAISRFSKFCNLWYSGNYGGLTLAITSNLTGASVCICHDCYITRIPSQEFGETATTQTWGFTCGFIDYQ